MKKKPACPCFGCIHRHIGCHADCERYAAWHDYRTKELRHLRKDDDAVRFKIDGVRKARAIAHRHKPK